MEQGGKNENNKNFRCFITHTVQMEQLKNSYFSIT